jgi:hypothetical protein
MYVGLCGLQLAGDHFDLGRGVFIRKTYGHLMTPFVLATKPAVPGQAHPGPWKAVAGNDGFDMQAELYLPPKIVDNGKTWEIGRVILFLLRLGVDPATTVPIMSEHSFGELEGVPDKDARIVAFETRRRGFELNALEGAKLDEGRARWVRERWVKTHELMSKSAEFTLAVAVMNAAQFQLNTALILVSLWGALEALFGGDRTELRFRLSSYIASYLVGYGNGRDKEQKRIAKLYDKRSAAVHGLATHSRDDVFETFVLFGSVLMKIVEDERCPRADR